MRKFIIILLLLIAANTFSLSAYADACTSQPPTRCTASATTTDCVFQLIRQRECLMQAVAADKYLHHGAIYDAKQETTVLLNIEKNAARYHLNPTALQIFSQIQMDISKQIETYWFQYWQTNKITPTASINLIQLRQSIITLDTWTLDAIVKALPALHNKDHYHSLSQQIANQLNITGIPQQPDYHQMLLNALIQIN